MLADVRRVLRRHARSLRRDLPWIGCGDPWAILVSEVMLQQTQASRVVEPWQRFVARFPTPEACATAPLDDVLRAWEGLGYHRRAKNLWRSAREITQRFGGAVPRSISELRSLPGVGSYTAAAVASFAFNQRVAVLDTNVGRVLARCVANRELGVAEANLLAHELLPKDDVASFNQAVLDLGAQFCRSRPRCETCALRLVCRWRLEGGEDPAPRSAAVSKPQAPFAGSRRQLRGQLLAALREGPRSEPTLRALVSANFTSDVPSVLEDLEREGLLERRSSRWRLARA
ncbi:MAG TPA: A/G-specific adenine glycosylase [Acidimicrobiales bacterium]|nr:A/G-specific adenine glycosylase [Acidimicrobiales bacterium]